MGLAVGRVWVGVAVLRALALRLALVVPVADALHERVPLRLRECERVHVGAECDAVTVGLEVSDIDSDGDGEGEGERDGGEGEGLREREAVWLAEAEGLWERDAESEAVREWYGEKEVEGEPERQRLHVGESDADAVTGIEQEAEPVGEAVGELLLVLVREPVLDGVL